MQEAGLAPSPSTPYVEYVFAGKEGDVKEPRPHAAAWWKRISERPSWKKITGKA